MSEEAMEATEIADVQDTAPADDWKSTIPEEIRGHASLEHINDIGALAKSYVHAQQMVGADKVALPGKSATEDEWAEVYNKLGRPESPDGYQFELNNLPEGAELDEGMVEWFKQTAHKAGMNPRQAQAMLDAYNEMTFSQYESSGAEVQARVEQVEAELRKEYGQAFDDKIALANGVLAEFGNPEITEVQLADGSMLGDHPDVIRMLSNMGTYLRERVGEDTLEGVKTSGGITPNDAQSKIKELTQQNSPYWDSRHPEHQWYVNEAMKWREYIAG